MTTVYVLHYRQETCAGGEPAHISEWREESLLFEADDDNNAVLHAEAFLLIRTGRCKNQPCANLGRRMFQHLTSTPHEKLSA